MGGCLTIYSILQSGVIENIFLLCSMFLFNKLSGHFQRLKFTQMQEWTEKKTVLYLQNTCQSLLQYPSLEVSPSLRCGACALTPAFGQLHTSLAWASLYPIDWGWACHWMRIKVLRLSIKGGWAMRGTCQRFVCCQGLVSARRRYGCRIAKAAIFLPAPKSLQDQTALLPRW